MDNFVDFVKTAAVTLDAYQAHFDISPVGIFNLFGFLSPLIALKTIQKITGSPRADAVTTDCEDGSSWTCSAPRPLDTIQQEPHLPQGSVANEVVASSEVTVAGCPDDDTTISDCPAPSIVSEREDKKFAQESVTSEASSETIEEERHDDVITTDCPDPITINEKSDKPHLPEQKSAASEASSGITAVTSLDDVTTTTDCSASIIVHEREDEQLSLPQKSAKCEAPSETVVEGGSDSDLTTSDCPAPVILHETNDELQLTEQKSAASEAPSEAVIEESSDSDIKTFDCHAPIMVHEKNDEPHLPEETSAASEASSGISADLSLVDVPAISDCPALTIVRERGDEQLSLLQKSATSEGKVQQQKPAASFRSSHSKNSTPAESETWRRGMPVTGSRWMSERNRDAPSSFNRSGASSNDRKLSRQNKSWPGSSTAGTDPYPRNEFKAKTNQRKVPYPSNIHELILTLSQDIEYALRHKFNVVGEGLGQLLNAVDPEVLPSKVRKDLHGFRLLRNKLVHERDYAELIDRNEVIGMYEYAMNALKGSAARALKVTEQRSWARDFKGGSDVVSAAA